MKFKASVIVSVYDNTKFLKLVLDSLKIQSEKNFEIIISEDGQSEEMKTFVADYPFVNDFQHLTQKDNGWQKNKALNNAIRHATSDWLIFIDGDCVLHPRFVEMHLRFARDNHILAGKRVKLDERTSSYLENDFQATLYKLQNYLLKKLVFGKGSIEFIEEGIFIAPTGFWGFIPRIRKAKRLIGSNMSFSKEAIFAINGFDEEYLLPAVGEDTDLFWRFKAAGFRVKSVRNMAVQYHLYHPENWTETAQNRKRMLENQQADNFFCLKGLIQD